MKRMKLCVNCRHHVVYNGADCCVLFCSPVDGEPEPCCSHRSLFDLECGASGKSFEPIECYLKEKNNNDF